MPCLVEADGPVHCTGSDPSPELPQILIVQPRIEEGLQEAFAHRSLVSEEEETLGDRRGTLPLERRELLHTSGATEQATQLRLLAQLPQPRRRAVRWEQQPERRAQLVRLDLARVHAADPAADRAQLNVRDAQPAEDAHRIVKGSRVEVPIAL